ncbi:MAG: YdeI/OmpD-associated family protein [Flavobacteriales bacterium]
MAAKKPTTIHRFTAPMQRMDGEFRWHYLEFPHDVEKLFGTKGRVRVKGTINGVVVDRALMPTKSGIHIIIVGGDIRKAANLRHVGDLGKVEIRLNTEPEKPDMPEELAETLAFLPAFKVAWERLRPGMQRSMCYWIGSGKTEPTRAKRVADLLRRSENGERPFGPHPARRDQ